MNPKNPNSPSFFHPQHLHRVRRRPALVFPTAGGLAGGGERRRPAKTVAASFIPYPSSSAVPCRTERRRVFFPVAGALAGGGRGLRRPVTNWSSPPVPLPLLAPQNLHQKPLEPQATGKKPPMVVRCRAAALLPAPSPARASTPWVSARPSSGPVVAPKLHFLHAVAAASFCSSSPARRRVNPH
jgi:hypothetical protein